MGETFKSYKIFYSGSLILGSVPWFFSISILVFYLHAYKILGNLPYYNSPDPKELYIYNFYSPYINFGYSLWLLSIIPFIIFVAFFIKYSKKKLPLKFFFFAFISQIVSIALFFSEIFNWYND